MSLKTLDKANIRRKRVLLRVAYDITLTRENGKWIVPDDQRIKATLPTIDYLLKQNCSLILMSWIGRPTPGKIEAKYKLDPVAYKLSDLLGTEVKKLDQTIGPEVEQAVSQIQSGDIVMLENTRFIKGEKEADSELAKKMAKLADFVVYDAFAQAHRVHASTTGILENHRKTCSAGFLMEKELKVLQQILKGAMEPLVIVLGGAKISDKIPMIRNIINKTGMILIGGGLSNPFFKAKSFDVGGSLMESAFVDQAKGKRFNPVEIASQLLSQTKDDAVPHELIPERWPNGGPVPLSKIQLPVDIVIGKKKTCDSYDDEIIRIEKINSRKRLCGKDEAILDTGPVTNYIYSEIVKRARTIFWNGPMGYFEDFNYSQGTKDLARAIADSKGFSIIGGGDTEGVIPKFELENQFGHVSTGGGASLALLAGQELPVMKYLEV